MYLSTPLVKLCYQSGSEYVASLEDSTGKIRLFWEDDDETDYEWQCFSVFDSPETHKEIINQANRLIVAHKLEAEETLEKTVEM